MSHKSKKGRKSRGKSRKKTSARRKQTKKSAINKQFLKSLSLPDQKTYDPLGLLNPGMPMGTGMPMGMGMGMQGNPLNVPLMLPGVMRNRVIYTPNVPKLDHVNFKQNDLGKSLLAPGMDALYKNYDELPKAPMFGGMTNEMLDTAALAKLDPSLQTALLSGGQGFEMLMKNMAPHGLHSMFMAPAYMNYLKNYQHKDELVPVMNNTTQRPGMATYVTDADNKPLEAERLAIISSLPLSK